jgi:hypothetical protein
MRLILLPLLLLAAASIASADIYRWTDAEGNVVFGDRPPEDVEAERIQVRPPMTTPAMPEAQDVLERAREERGAPPSAAPYEALRITSPGDDEPVRANDGNFPVHVEIRPELRRGHLLRLIMDGAPVDTQERPRFDLVNVDRGTHRIQVQVLDRNGRVVQESAVVEFHVLRHHIGRPPPPPPPPPSAPPATPNP